MLQVRLPSLLPCRREGNFLFNIKTDKTMPSDKPFSLRFFGIIAFFTLLVACTPKEEKALRYVQEGKALMEQGNADKARVQFKNALQLNPKLAEAYYNMGLLDEKSQNWKGVFGNMSDAVRLDPKIVDAHLKLGQLYLAGRQYDKASQEVALVKQLKPDLVGGFALEGAILFSQGKKAEGIGQVTLGLEKDPTNLDATMLLASLYLTNSQYAEALSVLKKGIESHPQDIGLQLQKIRVEVDSKDYDAAVNDYQTLIANNPDKKELNFGLVALLSKIGRQEQAEGVLRGLVEKYPAELTAKLALIEFLAKRDEAEAVKALIKFAAENPKEIALQTRLVGYYVSKKQYTDAQTVLNHIIDLDKLGKDGMAARVELAKIAVLQNDIKLAESMVDKILADDGKNTQALMMRAAMRLDRHETDGAISDLQIVVSGNPKLDEALVMLARAYQQNGVPDVAQNNYRKALEINPGNRVAALAVAGKMINGKEYDRAEEVLTAAHKASPNDIAVMQMLVQARILKKDWNGAQALAAELGQQPNGSAAGHFISGVILASQGNYDEAIKKFQQVLVEKPDFADALRELAKAYVVAGKQVQLVAFLKSFIEKNPTQDVAYETLASIYGSEKKWDDAVKVLQTALRVNPKLAAAYQTLARVYLAQKKTKEAVEVYQKGLAALPDNIPLMVDLAQSYERVKDVDAAIDGYRKILQKAPKYDLAVNNLAALLADYRTDKESLQEAVKLVEHFGTSTNPNLLDTYAWVILKSGDNNKALPIMKRVVADAPEVAVFRYHLAMAYHLASDNVSAKTQLERALSLAEKQGDFTGADQARELAKELSAKTAAKAKSP